MSRISGFDRCSPGEIAERLEAVNVTKANLPSRSTIASGVLAGVLSSNDKS